MTKPSGSMQWVSGYSGCRAVAGSCLSNCGITRPGRGFYRTFAKIGVFSIKEMAPTRAFSWLKAASTAFTFETLLY